MTVVSDLTLPDRLKMMPADQIRALLIRTSPGVWAEEVRGFENAPLHKEWYRLMPNATRLAVIAPREHAKTECFTVNQTAWRSIYQPGTWTYVFANTLDQAQEIKDRIDRAIEARAGVLPGRSHQLLPRKHPARTGGQHPQEAKLIAGQLEGTVSTQGLLYTTFITGDGSVMVPNSVVLNLAVIAQPPSRTR